MMRTLATIYDPASDWAFVAAGTSAQADAEEEEVRLKPWLKFDHDRHYRGYRWSE